jgi:hypothetical protein
MAGLPGASWMMTNVIKVIPRRVGIMCSNLLIRYVFISGLFVLWD